MKNFIAKIIVMAAFTGMSYSVFAFPPPPPPHTKPVRVTMHYSGENGSHINFVYKANGLCNASPTVGSIANAKINKSRVSCSSWAASGDFYFYNQNGLSIGSVQVDSGPVTCRVIENHGAYQISAVPNYKTSYDTCDITVTVRHWKSKAAGT